MRQQSLFGAAEPTPPEIPGLVVHRDWVDRAYERELLAHIDAGAWDSDFRRRIQLYGLGYERGDDGGATRWVRDFPGWLERLAARLVGDGWLPHMPDNCVINDYAPGVGIGPHTDFPAFAAPLVALSLLSDVVLDFSRRDVPGSVPVVVPARSLWSASGEARWRWMHAIAARRSDVIDGVRVRRDRRVSLTFRVARDPAARAR